MGPQGPAATLVDTGPSWGSIRSRLSGIRERAKANAPRTLRSTARTLTPTRDELLSVDEVDFLRDIGAL